MKTMATDPASTVSWHQANYRYLQGELRRLRLILQRRVLWLRKQWKQDPLQTYQGLVISDAQADRLLAGENRQAEGRFYHEDREASAITRSITEVERDLGEQGHAFTEAGKPPAIDMLLHLFGLTSFARNVILLCLAPELDPTFERLFAYIQDDATRKYTTPHLALTLFGGEGESWLTARESLMPHAVLRRFRLVTLEPGPLPGAAPSTCPLRLGERVADYLMGVNRLDERIAELLPPMPPTLLTPHQSDLLDRLYNRIEADGRQGPWPAINMIGPPGAGKRALARALCERLGLQLYGLNVAGIPASGPERQELFRLLEREAVLLQFALYLDAVKIEEAVQSNAMSSIDDVVERLSVFLIVGSREQWQTEHKMIMVQVAKLDASAQRALWEQALAGVHNTLKGEVEDLSQQFEFGPTAIIRTIVAAQDRARLRVSGEGAEVTADDLWQACREQAGWGLDELAQRIIPCHMWEDIVLPEDVYRQLQEIAAQVANRSQVYEAWGFGAKLNRGRGISALFAGPSGTGKTLAAEILANHLQLDLYRIDLSGVVSKYIGETEKNLRKVFDAAEQSGAILFFDEADALFGKRSEVKDSHDRYANIEINYLLQRMEEYRGLAILATNRKSHLDQAFMRRLRFLVDFPFPDASHRVRIWQKVFPEKAAVEELDYVALSRMEISGGSIKNIAVNAAFLAAGDRGSISMEHVLQAARREYSKIDKLMLESEFGPYYTVVRR